MIVQADLDQLAGSFRRSLRAANKSLCTVATCLEALRPVEGLQSWDRHTCRSLRPSRPLARPEKPSYARS